MNSMPQNFSSSLRAKLVRLFGDVGAKAIVLHYGALSATPAWTLGLEAKCSGLCVKKLSLPGQIFTCKWARQERREFRRYTSLGFEMQQ